MNNATEAIKDTLNEWLLGLDEGNLDRMLATCDPEVIVCNERQPTTFGIEAIRTKYGALIAKANFASTFDTQSIKIYGDFAIVLGHWVTTITDKASGQTQRAEGRLAINYRRYPDGSWKMLLDMDNNDGTEVHNNA